MNITNNTKIGDLFTDINNYEVSQPLFTCNDRDEILKLVMTFKKKQPSAEELAAKLGFKINDKVWSKLTNAYAGVITSFNSTVDGRLQIITDNDDIALSISVLTNKLAIHTPTKEDFDFIISTGIKHTFRFEMQSVGTNCLNEYMLSQGIKPLFVTRDGINIWHSKVDVFVLCLEAYREYEDAKIIKIKAENAILLTEIFSTEQAAKNYLESLKPKFKVGDYIIANYYKGSKDYKGQIAKVLSAKAYQYIDGFVEANSNNFEGCRLATKEEIEAITKPKTIEVEIPDGYEYIETVITNYAKLRIDEVVFKQKEEPIKLPILTTEDGVKVYDNNNGYFPWGFYEAQKDNMPYHLNNVKIKTFLDSIHDGRKCFSSKEALHKYLYNLEVQKLKEKYNQ